MKINYFDSKLIFKEETVFTTEAEPIQPKVNNAPVDYNELKRLTMARLEEIRRSKNQDQTNILSANIKSEKMN